MAHTRWSEFEHVSEVLAKKELLLIDLRKWLEDKGLWKQFLDESGWKIGPSK